MHCIACTVAYTHISVIDMVPFHQVVRVKWLGRITPGTRYKHSMPSLPTHAVIIRHREIQGVASLSALWASVSPLRAALASL